MATGKKSIGYVTLVGVINKEDRQYVSLCPQLGVASCGDTVEEATGNLKDAVESYFEALRETGELARVLAERGLAAWPDAAQA